MSTPIPTASSTRKPGFTPRLAFACALTLLPLVAAAQIPADAQPGPEPIARARAAVAPTLAPEPPASEPPPTTPAPLSAVAYRPVSGRERIDWTVVGTIGPRSLGVGVIAASWNTAWNSPEEWEQGWSGWGKRYLQREADVAISNSMEAGLGALWGEDPRYIPSGRKGIWPRARYAMKTVLLAQRPDGRLAPAWGRYAANTLNNVIENAWLPPSATTARSTTVRSVNGFLGRLVGNLWDEFWPDARRLVFKR